MEMDNFLLRIVLLGEGVVLKNKNQFRWCYYKVSKLEYDYR